MELIGTMFAGVVFILAVVMGVAFVATFPLVTIAIIAVIGLTLLISYSSWKVKYTDSW